MKNNMKKFFTFLGIIILIVSTLIIGKIFWDKKFFAPDPKYKMNADNIEVGWDSVIGDSKRVKLSEMNLEKPPHGVEEIKNVLPKEYRLFEDSTESAYDGPVKLYIYSTKENQWYGSYFNFRYGLYSFKSSDYGYKNLK